MVQLSQEEIRQRMAEILKEQAERPTLRPNPRADERRSFSSSPSFLEEGEEERTGHRSL